jgi:hypothetical protein
MPMKPALKIIAVAVVGAIAIAAQTREAAAFMRFVPHPPARPGFAPAPFDRPQATQPYKGHFGGVIGSAYLADPRPCCAAHEAIQQARADHGRDNRWFALHTPK